jgi:hypothetical protein
MTEPALTVPSLTPLTEMEIWVVVTVRVVVELVYVVPPRT